MTKQVRRLMFSRDAYTEMFRERAKGKPFKSIADKFGCSDVFIAEVIKKKTRQEETAHVPPKLVEKAQNVKKVLSKGGVVKKTDGSKIPTPQEQETAPVSDPVPAFMALGRLVNARNAYFKELQACLDSGFSKAYIELSLEEIFKKGE